MKLRNKKTGEIIDLQEIIHQKYQEHNYNSLAELNEEWEDYEEPKDHYYIDYDGDVMVVEALDYEPKIKDMKLIGNYFETKEEAEKAAEKLKALKRLEDAGFKFTAYDLYSGSSVKDKTEGEFAIGAECSDFVDNKDLDLLFGGEEWVNTNI